MSAQSSTATTPFTQSRRASQESARSNTSAKGDKHFSQSMKKLWTTVKKHAIEHHNSVNAAYDACYGQGRKEPVKW